MRDSSVKQDYEVEFDAALFQSTKNLGQMSNRSDTTTFSITIKKRDIQHNDTRYNGIVFCADGRLRLSSITCFSDCHKRALYAECRYSECRYTECRGAIVSSGKISKPLLRFQKYFDISS
jgi:hypothetical protein